MLERLTSEDVVEELTVGETGDTIDFYVFRPVKYIRCLLIEVCL